MKTKPLALLTLALLPSFFTPANADLKDGLVAHWSFDDCRATDNSGNGHDGTLGGNPQCVDGVKGKAFSFDGVKDYVDLTGKPIAQQGNNPRSMFVWVKTTDQKGYQRVVVTGTTGFNQAFNILLWGNGQPGIMGYAPVNDFYANTGTVTDGKWHFIGATYDGNISSIWIDGVLKGSKQITYNTTGNDNFIGRSNDDQTTIETTYFNGNIDDPRIYNRALTEAEVMELYNGKTELTYTPEPDPTPIIGTMPDPKLEASGTIASQTKMSWGIPAYNNCNENRFNSKSSTLTSEICYNNIQGATVSVMPVGTSKSKMIVSVNPTNQTGSYFFKATFPSELKISPLSTLNLQPLSEDNGDEVAEVLSIIGDEVMGQILGKLNFPLQLLTRTVVAGDPPFLNLLAARKGNSSILSKQLYPYQTIEYHLERKTENVAMMFVFQSDVSFSTFKKLLDKHGVSFYFGSDRAHELLIEKLKSK